MTIRSSFSSFSSIQSDEKFTSSTTHSYDYSIGRSLLHPSISSPLWTHIMTELSPTHSTHSDKLEAGQIRLVLILPDHPNDDINTVRLATRIWTSRKQVTYTALSYAWQSTLRQHRVIVDGRERRVVGNLWHFLRCAKKMPELSSRWFWIDALSILQWDTEERAHQVRIMSKIFGHADQVVAWLGPAYGNSDIVMLALDTTGSYLVRKECSWQTKIASGMRKECDVLTRLYPPCNDSNSVVRQPLTSASSLHDGFTAPPIAAICELCERTYWQRLWVFQELKHAQDIVLMCGNLLCPWNRSRLSGEKSSILMGPDTTTMDGTWGVVWLRVWSHCAPR